MTTQNSIGTGYLASNSDAIQQSDTRKLMTPSTMGTALNLTRNESPGRFENLSMDLNAGTMIFVGFNGNVLSSTNPAYVNIPSKVYPGRTVRHQLTTGDYSFNKNELSGSLFGTTNVVAWLSPLPFYVYAVSSDADANPVFAICRVPHLMLSPTVANSGKPSVTVSAEQGFWYLDDTINLADYDGNPCVCLGSFSMTKSGANIWTISNLSSSDGFGNFNEATRWEFPDGQSGSATGKYLRNNGGTAPTFTSVPRYDYSIKRSGLIDITCYLSNSVGGTAGAGAVNAQLSMPLRLINGDLCICRLTGASDFYATLIPNAASAYAVFNDITTSGGAGAINLAQFSTVGRIISFGLTTQIPIL